MDAEVTSGEWPRTNEAVLKLQDLLRCSICNQVMSDPHTLTSCEHYFCRECISVTLSDGCCPECGLPGWVKDLSPNYQLAGLISHLNSLKDLLGCSSPSSLLRVSSSSTQGEFLSAPHTSLASTNGGPSFHVVRPTTEGASHTEIPGKEHPEDNGSSIFIKPPVTKQLIQRKMCLARRSLSLERDEERPRIVKAAAEPALEESGARIPLTPINGFRFSVSPVQKNYKLTQQRSLFTAKTITSSEGTVRLSRSPPSKRRRSAPSSCCSSLVSEFPFSPMVTKTRSFSQLDSNARIQRLKEVTSGSKSFPWIVHSTSAITRKKPASPSTEKEMVRKRRKKLRQLVLTSCGTADDDDHENLWTLKRVCNSKETSPTVVEKTKKRRTRLRQLELPLEPDPQSEADDRDEEHPLLEDVRSRSPPPTPFSLLSQTLRRNVRGETPLHIAAIKGDVAGVRELLAQDANPNIKDHAGWTPLHEACNHGHVQVVELLLNHGALVNIPGYDNDTPLHDALANSHVKIAESLVRHGADVNIKNRRGLTPINLVLDEAVRAALLSASVSTSSPTTAAIRSYHASPVLNGSPSKVVLLGSGLKQHHKTQLSKAAKLFGAEMTTSFSPQVTHVITSRDGQGCCTRTMKCLSAVACGKWLLGIEWITESLASQEWLDERKYEVNGFAVNGEASITEAPRKGRENALMKLPGLFDGCEFYFQGPFPPPHPSKELLSQLVALAGGTILSRGPREDTDIWSTELSSRRCYPYHAMEQSLLSTTNRLIVCSRPTQRHVKGVPRQYLMVPSSWILDCLSNYILLDPPSLL